MATSSTSLDEWREFAVDEWREFLQDINFCLHGYQSTDAYGSELGNKMHWGGIRQLGENLYTVSSVHWNVGVGPAASFTRAISAIALEEATSQLPGRPFDHVIKVELKEEAAAHGRSLRELAVAVAEELGLLDQEYSRLKEADDELRYYTYGMQGRMHDLERFVLELIVSRVKEMLSNKRYLLLAENLYKPIHPTDFADVGIPPHSWTGSQLVMSTTSLDVYDKSKSEGDGTYGPFTNDGTLMIILSALRQSAKHIFNTIRQGDERYWHHVVLRCFHYAMLLFPQCSPPNGDGDHQSSSAPSLTSDELIHQWLAQGILNNKPKLQENGSCSSKYHIVHQVGRVILEAFQEYSLLQLPFSPAREADEATKSAAHFLLYHSLIAEGLTVHELSDNKKLERKKWISFIDDQGWHVSREWLTQEETSGSTALILRGCSQHSLLFSIFDSCMPKLCFLHVLDLSYTPVNQEF